jgi:hypothetical protein
MEKPEDHSNRNKTLVNQTVISALEELFQFSSPDQLKKSLMEILFSYLCNTNVEDYKPDMKEVVTDFYFLLKFLEIAEKDKKKKS